MAQNDDVDKLLDEMLKGKTPEEILGQGGVLKGLTKRLVERALEGEMTTHLGYAKHAPEGRGSGNSRNGKTGKSILTGEGELDIEVPRDRKGDFDPQLVKKGQRRPWDRPRERLADAGGLAWKRRYAILDVLAGRRQAARHAGKSNGRLPA